MDSGPPIAFDMNGALAGSGAPPPGAYRAALARAEEELAGLLKATPRLGLLTEIERRDDIAEAQRIAEELAQGAGVVFVLGIGGSSLGGQALLEAVASSHSPRLVFLDNPDPVTLERAFAETDFPLARFVAISKSGGTAETLAQALIAADAIRKATGGADLGRRFAVVTENRPNPLRRFAESIGAAVLDHPPTVGGRYSVLTVVGVLPALLAGLNAHALREGAGEILASGTADCARGAALHLALLREGRLKETVLFPYSDRLKSFSHWWRQLWAESLGKGGKGTTPIVALGPVDQHSQLQLFLDGPGHSLFTLIDAAAAGKGAVIPPADARALGLAYLAGRRIGDLVDAEMRATADSLAGRGRPVRCLRAGKLDERTMGALFMHFMLETILMGRLMGVDPFDQPAVEEGKLLARQYLSAMGA